MKPTPSVGVREAARKLGCTTKYIYDLLYGGQLRGFKVGKTWSIPLELIEARLKARGGSS
jgi:excisionase family DNA binding protein